MGEAKPRFISDIREDLPTLRDLSAHLATGRYRWGPGLSTILIVCVAAYYLLTEPAKLTWISAIFFLAEGFAYLRNRDGGPEYRKRLQENGGIPKRNLVYLHEDFIRYRNPETGNVVDFPYSRINRICKTRMHHVLYLDDGTFNLINHTNLTGGDSPSLEQFLLERTGAKQIEAQMDNRIFGRISNVLMAVCLVISLFVGYDFFTVEPKALTAREAAQILSDLGIDPPGEEELNELDEYGADAYMMENLLYYAGCGSYDFETWEWTPADSGVYTFDMEVMDVGYMYTNFLRGVSTMSRGELEFTDISEDDSNVNFESGTGYKIVTFTYGGKAYTLRPEMMNDWFDLEFANDLARIVGENQDGKRLYFHIDGYQMISVFYADADWVKAFERATGYPLTKTIG